MRYHRELADAAVALAEHFDGLIDLSGTPDQATDIRGARWEFSYDMFENERGVSWLVSSSRLRAWKDHPHFSMVG
jgi:hypothetical protein